MKLVKAVKLLYLNAIRTIFFLVTQNNTSSLYTHTFPVHRFPKKVICFPESFLHLYNALFRKPHTVHTFWSNNHFHNLVIVNFLNFLYRHFLKVFSLQINAPTILYILGTFLQFVSFNSIQICNRLHAFERQNMILRVTIGFVRQAMHCCSKSCNSV